MWNIFKVYLCTQIKTSTCVSSPVPSFELPADDMSNFFLRWQRKRRWEVGAACWRCYEAWWSLSVWEGHSKQRFYNPVPISDGFHRLSPSAVHCCAVTEKPDDNWRSRPFSIPPFPFVPLKKCTSLPNNVKWQRAPGLDLKDWQCLG